jgi:hypothetical protein
MIMSETVFIIESVEESAELAYAIWDLIRNDVDWLSNIENHVAEALKEYKYNK